MSFELPDREFDRIAAEIDAAMADAPTKEEADRLERASSVLKNKFIKGQIGQEEFEREISVLGLAGKGEVVIPDLGTMKRILDHLLGDEALADELVEHEKGHYEETLKQGFNASELLLRFFKDGEDVDLRPAIRLKIPKKIGAEGIREGLKKVIESPRDPSDTDADSLSE